MSVRIEEVVFHTFQDGSVSVSTATSPCRRDGRPRRGRSPTGIAVNFNPRPLLGSTWRTTASVLICPSSTRNSILACAPTGFCFCVLMNSPRHRDPEHAKHRLDHYSGNKPTRLPVRPRTKSAFGGRPVDEIQYSGLLSRSSRLCQLLKPCFRAITYWMSTSLGWPLRASGSREYQRATAGASPRRT